MAALLTSSIITSGNVSLVNGSATTAQTLLTVPGSGVTGYRVGGISAVSTDSAAHTLVLSITRSAVTYDIGTFTVAATSTITKATARIADICPFLAAGEALKLGPSDVLKIRCLTTDVTSGKKIDVIAHAEGWA